MARVETDREDLFAEATALVRRCEFQSESGESIVAGFRRDGSLSLYVSADPVYHFDPDGRLKRAYRSGLLYRTQGETLAELARQRTETETILRRRDLTSDETAIFVDEMIARLSSFASQLANDELKVVRQQSPADASLSSDLGLFISRLCNASQRLAPRFQGKR